VGRLQDSAAQPPSNGRTATATRCHPHTHRGRVRGLGALCVAGTRAAHQERAVRAVRGGCRVAVARARAHRQLPLHLVRAEEQRGAGGAHRAGVAVPAILAGVPRGPRGACRTAQHPGMLFTWAAARTCKRGAHTHTHTRGPLPQRAPHTSHLAAPRDLSRRAQQRTNKPHAAAQRGFWWRVVAAWCGARP
jgi:hypothetical protein